MKGLQVGLIDQYVIKELLQPFLFGLSFFVSIMLIDFLMDLITLIFSKGVPIKVVALFFIYYLPPALVISFPMALLLACLIAFGRLSSDSEVTALKAGGYSFWRIVFPAMLFGLFITLLTFLFNEKVVPKANDKFSKLFRDEVTLKRPLPRISENRFFDIGPNQKFFAQKVDQKESQMHGVVMYEGQPKNFPRVIEAEKANLGVDSCIFFNGRISGINAKGQDDSYTYFQELNYPVDRFYVPPGTITSSKTPRQMGLLELYNYNIQLEKNGASQKGLISNWVDFWTKTSIPFACIVFVLIGASLGTQTSRSGKSIGIGLSVVIIFVYYLFLATGKAFAAGEIVSPFLGAWLPNLIIGSLGLLLTLRSRA